MNGLLGDLQRAIRVLRASPALLFVGVLSLGLGLGVNLTLFTAIRAVFFYQPTLPDADRAVIVQPGNSNQFSYLNWRDLRDSGIFGRVAGFREVTLNYRAGLDTERIDALVVTPNFFDALAPRMAMGRGFGADEAAPERQPRVAVVSGAFWESRLEADAAIDGRQIRLNGESFTVVGVLPADYRPVTPLSAPDVYVPATPLVLPTIDDRRNGNALNVVGWLPPEASRRQVQAALTSFGAALERVHPTENANMGRPGRLVSLADRGFDNTAERLLVPAILVTLFGLVLLSACTNVAGLLLARSTHRRLELAVRMTLGASRARLLRMLLTEAFALALLGAIAGGLLSLWLTRWLQVVVVPGAGAIHLSLDIDPWWVVDALGLLLATCLLTGLAPSWHATRLGAAAAIQGSEGAMVTGRLRIRHAFVVLQVTACSILLVLSSLMLRSLFRVTSVDPGFDLDNGLVASVHLDAVRYAGDGGLELGERIVERLEQMPGVESAALANIVVLGTDASATRLQTERRPSASANPRTFLNSVSPGYFASLGIPVLRGRDFDSRDRAGSPPVAIVTRALVEAYFPGEDALGKRVRRSDDEPYAEIIGIVGDHKYSSYGEPASPILYEAYSQRPRVSSQVRPLVVHVRTTPGRVATLAAVRTAIEALDPTSAVDVQTLREAAGTEPALRLLGSALLGSVGGVGLLLATIGLYGMMSFAVASRAREIGIRMALGASATRVLWGVLAQGLALVAAGLVVGMALGLLTGQAMASLLAGLSPADGVSLLATSALLLAVGAAACYLPARRAARVDPLATLRYQ